MIISMPLSWVKIAIPQPTTSAGRTHGLRSPRQPRFSRPAERSSSSSPTISSSSASRSLPSSRTPRSASRASSRRSALTSHRGLSGQPQHQHEHDRRRHRGRPDRDPPRRGLARADQRGQDDPDADAQLERQDQSPALAGRGQLGHVHGDDLGRSADGEAEHDPGQRTASSRSVRPSRAGCRRRTRRTRSGSSCGAPAAPTAGCTRTRRARRRRGCWRRSPAPCRCRCRSHVGSAAARPEMMPVS